MTAVPISANELDHILRFVERFLQPAGEALEQVRIQLLAAHDTIYANGRKYHYGFVSRATRNTTVKRLRVMCDDDLSTLNRLFDLDFGECLDEWDDVTACLPTVLEPKIQRNGAVRDALLAVWWESCTPELVATKTTDATTVRAMVKQDATQVLRMYEHALCGLVVEQPLVLHAHLECSAAEQVFVALAAQNAELTPVSTWYALLIAYLARRVDRGMPVFRKHVAPPVPASTVDWLLNYYCMGADTDEADALRQLGLHWGRGYLVKRAVVQTTPSSFFSDHDAFDTLVEYERKHRRHASTTDVHADEPKVDQTLHTDTRLLLQPRQAQQPIADGPELGRMQLSSV